VTPGAVTITLDALTLAGSVPALTAELEEVLVNLDTLILVSTLFNLTVGKKKGVKAGWPFWRF
jgi:hypothetical protein